MGPARQAEANELLTVIQGNFEPNAEVNRSACPAHYRVHLRRDNEACLTSSSKLGTQREPWRVTVHHESPAPLLGYVTRSSGPRAHRRTQCGGQLRLPRGAPVGRP